MGRVSSITIAWMTYFVVIENVLIDANIAYTLITYLYYMYKYLRQASNSTYILSRHFLSSSKMKRLRSRFSRCQKLNKFRPTIGITGVTNEFQFNESVSLTIRRRLRETDHNSLIKSHCVPFVLEIYSQGTIVDIT